MNDHQRRRLCERLGIEIEEINLDIDIDLDNDMSEVILISLGALHRKVDCLMADLTQLNAAVDKLQAADAAVANELVALRDEIAQLQAGEITQEQIDSLAGRVTDVTTKLTEQVNAPDGGIGNTGGEPAPGEPTPPPADGEPGAPPVEEAPVGETPPPAEGGEPPVQ